MLVGQRVRAVHQNELAGHIALKIEDFAVDHTAADINFLEVRLGEVFLAGVVERGLRNSRRGIVVRDYSLEHINKGNIRQMCIG